MKRFIISVLLLSLLGCVAEEGPALEEDTSENPINPPNEELSKFARHMLDAVNELRSQGCDCGSERMQPVSPLKWSGQLEVAALTHAKDMATHQFLDHKGSDGSTPGQRITASGYRWRNVGENIASGHPTLTGVVRAWQESPGHCRNMMSPDFEELGAARVDNYWVQDFAR